jgi:hypothetical protein
MANNNIIIAVDLASKAAGLPASMATLPLFLNGYTKGVTLMIKSHPNITHPSLSSTSSVPSFPIPSFAHQIIPSHTNTISNQIASAMRSMHVPAFLSWELRTRIHSIARMTTLHHG